MATIATNRLSVEDFARIYAGEKTHEYWYGEAIPKGMPTWIHGLLQRIVLQLLVEVGWRGAAAEVELRIDPEARPRPDVIAVQNPLPGPYPTEGVDIVVEIISEDDTVQRLREKCTKYQEWNCKRIYTVDPSDRSVSEWRDGSFLKVSGLAGIPAERIWSELDAALR